MKSGALETSQSYLFEPFNERDTPERQLLLAVLERAILDFVGNDKKEAAEAGEWIFGDALVGEVGSPRDTSGDSIESSENQKTRVFVASAEPFTFPWVCKELDLDPQSVARMIHAMPKRGASRVAPWYLNRDSRGDVAQDDVAQVSA